MCFPCSTELVYYPTGHHWLPIHWEDWGLRRTNLMSKGRRERWREVKDESEEEGGWLCILRYRLLWRQKRGGLEGDKERGRQLEWISIPSSALPLCLLLFPSIPSLTHAVSASVVELFLSLLRLCFPVKVYVAFSAPITKWISGNNFLFSNVSKRAKMTLIPAAVWLRMHTFAVKLRLNDTTKEISRSLKCFCDTLVWKVARATLHWWKRR